MSDLSEAVNKTMNFVFADIDAATNEKTKRLELLKANVGKVANIAIDDIETDQNIRNKIDTKGDSFQRLVESVKKYGILENIVVELRLGAKAGDFKLVCIAGHRRILAAKTIGTISKIPCLLQLYNKNGDSVGAALTENLNREDLHCLDIAEGYQSLIKSGWSESDISKYFCRDIRTIKHYLKMASWPLDIKKLIRKNSETLSTRVLLRNFAYRKFNSMTDLGDALNNYLSPKETKALNVKKKNMDKEEISLKKSQIKKSLQKYLAHQKTLSAVIKEEIEKAFVELDLI